MRTWILALGLLGSLPLAAAQEPELSLKIQGIKSDKGQIVVTVYRDAESWLKKELAVETQKLAPTSEATIRFHVKPGVYAVHVFQDENANGKLDMRWLPPGPAEPWVVTNNAQGTMGPPSFKDAKIDIQSDLALTLQLQD